MSQSNPKLHVQKKKKRQINQLNDGDISCIDLGSDVGKACVNTVRVKMFSDVDMQSQAILFTVKAS